MAFNNIDAPGENNRRARRAVAVIQHKAGAEGRKAAAEAKRQRKMAHQFSRNLGKTIVFYAARPEGVFSADPDGAYLSSWESERGARQIVLVGNPKASIEHYVKAIGEFLKKPMRLVSNEPLLYVPDGYRTERPFLSIIVEPAK